MNTITIKKQIIAQEDVTIELPAYFKHSTTEYFIAILEPHKHIVVQLYEHSLKVDVSTLSPFLEGCTPCTAEQFYQAASLAMEKLNAALLPTLNLSPVNTQL